MTVLIAAVLATIAMPSFVDLIRSTQLTTAGDQLYAEMLLARREAIKRNTRVLFCSQGASAGHCGTTVAAWTNGWLVCYDADADGDCDASTANNPNPIRQHGPVDSTLTVTGSAATARFNPDGTQGDPGAAALTLTVRGTWTGSKSYVGTVSSSGNVSLAKGN